MKTILPLLLISIILVSGCIGSGTGTGTISLSREITLPELACSERGLGEDVIVIGAAHCPACQKLEPILHEIEEELETEFTYYDLDQNKHRTEVGKLDLEVAYTPTVLVGCKVYIGGKSKEEYKTIIEKFLTTQ